jgi:hypothetical protein
LQPLHQETKDKVEAKESDENSKKDEEAKKPTNKRVRFGKNWYHPALKRQKK